MRTRKSTVCLLILFVYLCCLVQQCHNLMFGLLANSMSNAVSSAVTMSSALGMTIASSMMQSLISTFTHGFSTLHTMAMSTISGFIMGNLFLVGFILFLMAIVPSDELDRRSLGGPGLFNSPLFQHHLLPHIPSSIANPIEPNFSINNSRSKRSTHPLVSSYNATNLSFMINATSPINRSTSRQLNYNLRSASDDAINLFKINGTDSRIPRFLSRVVQSDPFNCLPLILCGLSAARKPNERTEVLNDYAYLLKEFMEPDNDKSDEDSGEEDDLPSTGNRYRQQTPMTWLDKLVQGQGKKKKDEVDKIIDELRKEEDDKIEDLVLTEMAGDPNDLTFALEDMKLRGLTKTISKMPHDSKKDYIKKLMQQGNSEEEDGELVPHLYHSDEEDVPLEMMRHHPRHEYPDSASVEMDEDEFFDKRDLVRGKFQPPPPMPPAPEYGVDDDFLYKKNLKILDESLKRGPPPFQRRRLGPPGPPPPGWRSKRDTRRAGPPSPPRGFLQKKRGEAAAADNIFDKARVGAQIGALLGNRNNRQCRALFNQCPINSLVKPGAESDAPFLNRAVNNLRRVLLGTTPGQSKQRRVNEIKEVIQQLHPQSNRGASEVRVVLNIGPTPPPGTELHGGGGNPPSQYMYSTLATPQSTKPVPHNDHYKNPHTTPRTGSGTTKKTMTYHKPVLPSALPTKGLGDLEKLLKTTSASINSDEDSTTNSPKDGETTIYPNNDDHSGEMEDEPVFPTQYPIPKDEYAQNLRETFNIFQRFKEASTGEGTTPKTTIRPRSTTTKKSSIQKVGDGNKKKVIVLKPGEDDLPEKDIEDQGEDDLQSILSQIKKIREKYWPKKWKKKRKKKKKKKNKHSSEESSEEHHNPHDHHHPLVAVPHPAVRQQINWKSGSKALKDGVYHFLFGSRVAKPLPDSPFNDHSSEFLEPDNYDHLPHDHQHPYFRGADSDSDSDQEKDVAQSSEPSIAKPSTSTIKPKTSKPKYKAKPKTKPTLKPASKPKTSTIIATRRPIKIKLKTPRPIRLPDSSEDEEDDMPPGPPGPPLPPPPHPFRFMPPVPPDSSESYEDPRDYYNMGPGPRPTKPQLLYTPFTHVTSRIKTEKNKNKSKNNSSKRNVPRNTKTSSKNSTNFSKTGTTTTAKPKRKILKYKNG